VSQRVVWLRTVAKSLAKRAEVRLPACLANVLAKRLANRNGQGLATSCWIANRPICRRPRSRGCPHHDEAKPLIAQVDDIDKRLRLG
jgi:hypothetical protein